MTLEPRGGFRDRLLGAQETSAALRDEYRKALDAMLNHKLTPRTRLLTWAGLIGAVIFAAFCVRAMIVHHDKRDSMIVLPVYAAVFLATAGWLGLVLRRGQFGRRASFAVTEWLGSIFVGVYAAVTLLSGLRAPHDPASTLSAVWAVMLIMVGFAWSTGNRISAATLETREHLLRVESKLAEMAERVGK